MSEVVSSPWIAWVVLLALALAGRRMLGSWLSPGAFVALLWAVYAGVSLAMSDYKQHSSGMWMIVALVFATQCGAVLSQTVGMRSAELDEQPVELSFSGLAERALPFSMLFTGLAFAGTLYCVVWSIHRFALSYSLSDLLSLGHLWSYARYIDGELEPWSVRLLTMWIYPAALLGGFVYATASRGKQRALSCLPILCAAINGAVEATRAGSLLCIVCWISGFFVVRYRQSRGKYSLFNRRLIFSLGAAALAGSLFFVAIDSLRASGPGEQLEVREDQARLQKYSFGGIAAFSAWFDSYTQQTVALGAYTFGGIFDLLNVKKRLTGVYEDYYALSIGGEQTNIYTAYRGLIEDFTPAGAVVFLFVFGLFAGSACRSRDQSTALLIQAGYYAFILFTPVISLFMYNGLVLAWCVSVPILSNRAHREVRAQEQPCG